MKTDVLMDEYPKRNTGRPARHTPINEAAEEAEYERIRNEMRRRAGLPPEEEPEPPFQFNPLFALLGL